jgi:putative NADH-flavin reductase
MKIFLLGATGSTGYEILRRLLNDKRKVKALVRDRAKLNITELKPENHQVELIDGDVLEREKLTQHFAGCDVIISALGTGMDNPYTEIYSRGGRNILSAMRHNGVKKLITMTSASIDMSDPSTDTFFMNRVIRPNYNKVYYDQTKWETILDDTKDIHWICVRPTKLVNKPFTGRYRVNLRHCPKGGWKISRADLADFIIKQIDSNEFVHEKPVIAY